MAKKRKLPRGVLVTAAGIALAVALWWTWQLQPGYQVEPGFKVVEDAFHYRRTDVMAEVTGNVVRILIDDRSDINNQKFVIRLENGQRVLVVHNLNTSERVPLEVNDQVTVRGQYVWTETGGTIRFTERDLSPRRRHGWIEYRGQRYD